jgi:hypothetical protein
MPNKSSRNTSSKKVHVGVHKLIKKSSRGHSYGKLIDDLPVKERKDKRLSFKNRNARHNLRDRQGYHSYIPSGTEQKGSSYSKKLHCCNCNRLLDKSEFCNYAVTENHRKHVGLNINCRDCNGGDTHTVQGYSLEDGFVVPDDDHPPSDDEWLPSDDDE